MEKLKKLFKRSPDRENTQTNNYRKRRIFKRFWRSKKTKKNYEEQFQKILLVTKGETIIKQCVGNLDNKELTLENCSTEIISSVLNNILSENSEVETNSSLDCSSLDALARSDQKAAQSQKEILTGENCALLLERTNNMSTCGTSIQSFFSTKGIKIDKQREITGLLDKPEEDKADNELKTFPIADLNDTDDESDDSIEVAVKNEANVLKELSDSKLFSSLFDEGFDKVIIKKLIDRRNLLSNAVSIVAKSNVQSRYYFQLGQPNDKKTYNKNIASKDSKRSLRKKDNSLEKYLEEEHRKEEEEKELGQLEKDKETSSSSDTEAESGIYVNSVDMFLMRNLKKFIPSNRLTAILKQYNKNQLAKDVKKRQDDSNNRQEQKKQQEDEVISRREAEVQKDTVSNTDVEADKVEEESRRILLEKRLKELREDIIILKKKIAEEMKRNVEDAAEIKQTVTRLKRPNEFYGATRQHYEHGPLGIDNVDWAALRRDHMRAGRIKAAVDFIFTLGRMEEECIAIQNNLYHVRNKYVIPVKK